MVVLTEINSVFWGVILEGGKKKYTQTTEKPVHISMAALDPSKPCGDGPVSVMIEHNTGSYVLCSLQKSTLLQQPLNLEFAAGEEISFVINGTGSVHLSGYVLPEDDFQQYGDTSDDEDLSEEDMESDEEDDEVSDEDEAVTKPGKKRRIVDTARASKRAKVTLADMEDDDDEDDSEDDDFIIDEAEEASDDEDDEDEEEEEEEEESDVEESTKPIGKKSESVVVEAGKTDTTTKSAKGKDKAQNKNAVKTNSTTPPAEAKDKTKNEKNAPKQQAAPVAAAAAQPKDNGESDGKKKKKKNKKKKNKNKAENSQQTTEPSEPSTSASPAPASKVPTKRIAEGGVVIEDIKQGHGPEAKIGKKVAVYYTGRLLNGKVFDCCTNGNGFKFKLGKKEVISGWDIGVSGMKVGGKRKLVIPPKMGYGSSKAGPIPANSTLVFDVELKSVN